MGAIRERDSVEMQACLTRCQARMANLAAAHQLLQRIFAMFSVRRWDSLIKRSWRSQVRTQSAARSRNGVGRAHLATATSRRPNTRKVIASHEQTARRALEWLEEPRGRR